MSDKIIIDGVDVSGCNYVILPKDSCPAKAQPYAKETSCIACSYYKQLQRKTQECEKLKKSTITLATGLNVRQRALEKIEEIVDDYNRTEKTSQYYRDGLEEILNIINGVKDD